MLKEKKNVLNQTNKPTTMDTLRWMHLGAALAHGCQAIGGFYLTNVTYKDRGLFQLENAVANGKSLVGQPYRLGNLVSAFPALSTLNHVWSLVDRSGYDQVLKQGYNPVRWSEYSLSAGLMYVVIAQLCGINDIKPLSMLLLSNIALQYSGYAIERDIADKRQSSARRGEVMGFTVFISTWLPLFVAFFTSLRQTPDDINGVLYSIVFILFGLMLCFGVVSVLQQRGRIQRFETVEKSYLVLSLVSKTLLTNLTLFGALFSKR
jgi:hypothetical protein